MGTNIEHFGSLSKVKHYAERLQSRMAHIRQKAEQGIQHGIAVVETNGAAFGWGYANERWGGVVDTSTGLHEIEVMGVPADVGVGVALIGLGMFGALGKYAEHGVNLGNGSASAFANRMGISMGRSARNASGTTTSGGRRTISGGSSYMPNYGGGHRSQATSGAR